MLLCVAISANFTCLLFGTGTPGLPVEAAFKDNSADKPGLDLSGIARTYEVPFSRSPYSADNLKAYQMLKKIIDAGRYDAIHCHTPMGAVVTRLAARDARKRGTKVIYTAHGFHFYNGAAGKIGCCFTRWRRRWRKIRTA